MRIYTKTGDDGTTGLLGNVRVPKDHPRLAAYGDVDELNAAIGVVLAHLPEAAEAARGWLTAVQSDLFVVGTLLATPSQQVRVRATLAPARAEQLEQQIDQMEATLKPLKNFILPQGNVAATCAHLARAVGRRAERHIVALSHAETVDPGVIVYMNRLSDFLFVTARWINHQEGGVETAWINPSGESVGPNVDRLSASLQKIEEEKRRRQTLFEKTTSDLQKKKELAEKNFKKSVDQINKEGGKVDPTIRPIDLD